MIWSVPMAAPTFLVEDVERVMRALNRGEISGRSPAVSRFEHGLTPILGREAAVCSSGTAALHIALLDAGVGPGDEVIVPALTFATCAAVVQQVGAKVVLVDVGPDLLAGVNEIIGAVTRKTKAVIVVHLLGNVVNVRAFPDHVFKDITIIEDCAQAFGEYKAGRYGQYSTFSFFANKTIVCGEGGAVTGPSDRLSRLKKWVDCGFMGRGDYVHDLPALNYRIGGMQAALGLTQLDRLHELLDARHKRADWYANQLKGRGRWIFAADVKYRVRCIKELHDAGIDARRMFLPLNQLEPYIDGKDFPNSTYARNHGVMLPTGPHVSREDIEKICEIVSRYQ